MAGGPCALHNLHNPFATGYCVQAWNLNLEQKEKILLERVQRRTTKKIEGLGNMSYEKKTKEDSTDNVRGKTKNRGDLIETFKIVKDLNDVDYIKFFQIISIMNAVSSVAHIYTTTFDKSTLLLFNTN